jgi:hypothetical protein
MGTGPQVAQPALRAVQASQAENRVRCRRAEPAGSLGRLYPSPRATASVGVPRCAAPTGAAACSAVDPRVAQSVRYPDAVTLRAEADAGEVLAAVDTGPGYSAEDSFARFDLARAGFVPISAAPRRPPPRPAPTRLRPETLAGADPLRCSLMAVGMPSGRVPFFPGDVHPARRCEPVACVVRRIDDATDPPDRRAVHGLVARFGIPDVRAPKIAVEAR